MTVAQEDTTVDLKLAITPEPKSTLWLAEACCFHFAKPKPNWWYRLWQRVLLGWKWEEP